MADATIAFTIRPARAEERAALVGLQRRASLMWEEDRDRLLAHPDVIDLPPGQIAEGCVFVCEAGDAVVGFGVVLPREDGAAELDGLFVDPAAWGRGIGRRLVEHGEAMARAAGAAVLNLVANRRATGFYTACGFQTLGEVQTPLNPAWAMTKPL